MENKSILVILAAGMGSRYGGAKQIDPIDESGNIIIDFSLFDAVKAGFSKVVFVIKKEMEADVKRIIGDKISAFVEVVYCYQSLEVLPDGYTVPEGRVKPWGTAHALLCAKAHIDAPFAVINSDDYYGKSAYKKMHAHLISLPRESINDYFMVGFRLKNTLSENGSVSRGVCIVDTDNKLVSICERTGIVKTEDGAAFLADNGKSWVDVATNSYVSMNFWGFTKSFTKELEIGFKDFLNDILPHDELKSEFFLPFVVDSAIKSSNATVTLLSTDDLWYGITYKEDKASLVAAIKQMKKDGLYPNNLWDNPHEFEEEKYGE